MVKYSDPTCSIMKLCLLVMMFWSLGEKAIAQTTGKCPAIVESLGKHWFIDVRMYNNVCYTFVNSELTWVEARKKCEMWGGDMVTIPDQGTMDFIKETLDNVLQWKINGVWIGLNMRDGDQWKWTTGDIPTYGYWGSGQPSKTFGWISFEDCACMRRKEGWKWHDYACDSFLYTYRYICQFQAIPVSTTTIQTISKTTDLPTTTTTDSPEPCPFLHSRCDNGQCIALSRWCDGENDCGDNSDESNCEPTITRCADNEFECSDKKCISSQWKCDGDFDCTDHSDEMNCEVKPGVCAKTEWACLDGKQCIHKAWKCDGEYDCFDGTDEQNC